MPRTLVASIDLTPPPSRRFDVVIPAFNEAETLTDVVRAALVARGVGKVFVVDDGSTDETAEVSRHAGAEVISLRPGRDKARALEAGVLASSSDVLVFFDGDILNCRPEHFEALAEPVVSGRAVLSCGLVDYGPVRSLLFLRLPPITGLRALRREIFEAIPGSKLNGFQIEIMINEVVARGRLNSTIRVLSGTGHRRKTQKVGIRIGLLQQVSMLSELLQCFRFVPLWTYWTYLRGLTVLPPSEAVETTHPMPEATRIIREVWRDPS